MIPSPFCEATCPAWGYHIAALVLDGGRQPLATLSWPASTAEAEALARLPLDFECCLDCGHIFSPSFDYTKVAYSQKPCEMFNGAVKWSQFLRGVKGLLSHLVAGSVVVEIGHGDGSLLWALAAAHPSGRCVGFDPHGAADGSAAGVDGVEFRAELFDPARHLAELGPQLVVSRHVLEHLINPLGFLQGLSLATSIEGLGTLAYFEVPCIDRTVAFQRSADFYYEHSSQFTTDSFTRMLSRSVHRIVEIGHGYGGEVIFGMVGLGVPTSTLQALKSAQQSRQDAEAASTTIARQLAGLHQSGKRIAVWGGTGKSAAFICRHGIDRERIPVVVDPDIGKVSACVPGTGQEIKGRDWLLDHPVDVVIVPPQWRAADIVLKMDRAGIAVDSILIEHKGALIDFSRDDHPFRWSRMGDLMSATFSRFTTDYIDTEDRPLLSGEILSASPVAMWLTQRLALRLVPALLQWLDSQTGVTGAADASGSRSTEPEVRNQVVHGFAQEAALAGLKRQPTVRAAASDGWLIHSVDLAPAEERITLTFRSADGRTAGVGLAGQELRQRLAILHGMWQRAEWPMVPWPEWMQGEAAPAERQIVLH